MAYAVELTVYVGGEALSETNSPQVNVSLTYRLERADGDVPAVVAKTVAEILRGYELGAASVREADSQNKAGEPSEEEPDEPSSPAQQGALRALLSRDNRSEAGLAQEIKSSFGVADFEQLTARQAKCWLLELQRAERQRAQNQGANPNQSNGRSH